MPVLKFALAACAFAGMAGGAFAQDAAVTTAPSGAGAPTAAAAASGSPAAPASAQTAPAAGSDSTDQQISAWIHRNDDGTVQYGGLATPPPPARAMHGEAGVGISSNGSNYQYGVADIPVGQRGDLVVGAARAEDHFRHGARAERQSLSLGFYWDGTKPVDPCATRPKTPEEQASWKAKCADRAAE